MKSIEQCSTALKELVVTHELGNMNEMIQDSVVKKTITANIRGCLLLEPDLTLEKVITITSQQL